MVKAPLQSPPRSALNESVERRLRQLVEQLQADTEFLSDASKIIIHPRSANSDTQEQVFNLLERWYVVGKPDAARKAQPVNRSDDEMEQMLPPDIEAAIAEVGGRDNAGLRQAAEGVLSTKEVRRLEDLNRKAQNKGLTAAEKQRAGRAIAQL